MAERPLFTRESQIRIDRDGRFWHDGARVDHPGLARAFARWIDVDPQSGRYILKNDVDWCFVQVDDAPMVVRQVERDAKGALVVYLSDESREPLSEGTLRIDEDEVPYCDVRGGKLPARFSREAAATLLDALGERAAALPRVPRGQGAIK